MIARQRQPAGHLQHLAHLSAETDVFWIHPTDSLCLIGLAVLARHVATLTAYLTNPDPASFRTHLTSLSFHTHMRRLSSPSRSRSSDVDAATGDSAASSAVNGNARSDAAGASGAAKRKGAANSGGNSADPRPFPQSPKPLANRHILSFSNRISLSIRTPSYKFTSYHLFSTVYVPSSRPHRAIPGVKKQQQLAAQRNHPEMSALLGLGGELWFGAFGRWFALRWWDSEDAEEEERRGRLDKGIREMVVEDDEPGALKALCRVYTHDTDSFTWHTADGSTYASANSASASGASTPSHPLPHALSSLSDSRSATSTANDLSASAKNVPPNSRLSKRVFRAGQRRPSPTSLTRLKTKAEHAAREALEAEQRSVREPARSASKDRSAGAIAVGSGGGDDKSRSAGGGGANGGHVLLGGSAATDPVLLELQAQLDELRATAAESERRLQDELEVLRGKKRDEDAFRAELKVKTKGLEEAKRAADVRRAEAEKELNERKAVVKEAQSRIDKLRDEIRAIERKGLEAVERKEKKQRERKEREKKLRDDVGKKRTELKEKEQGLEEVMQKVSDMERKLEVRRALLAGRRNELAHYAQQGMRAANHVPPQQAMPPNAAATSMYGPVPTGQAAAPSLPATATLGGVGAFASAFAAPFGQGAYGRRNYPYVHPLSANNSRPTSIRSGHFDPLTGAFQSAPSSPTLAPSTVPFDDHSPYSAGAAVDPASGWPTSFASGPNGAPHSLPHAGFLEHRLQHRAAHDDDGHPQYLAFEGRTLGDLAEVSPSLSDFPSGDPIGIDGAAEDGDLTRLRNLALPMQYLESGLLAGGAETPGPDGPLSPMTPHQTSLIPSQLFHLLDDDEDEDGLFNMPDSPTLRGALGPDNAADWQGLGLDVNRPIKPMQPRTNSHDSVTADSPQEPHAPALAALRQESDSKGTASATTSPVGPPPTSPFTAWAADPSPPATSKQESPSLAHPSAPMNGFASLSSAPGAHLTHRMSPSLDLDDDLPRAGLSLNPDAKAFAFSSMAPGGLIRTSSPGPGGARPNRLSFPGSNQASPTAPASPSPLANTVGTIGNGAALASGGPFSSRLSPANDWPSSSTSAMLPSTAAVVAPIGSGLGPAAAVSKPMATGGFNPFGAEDDLLGPLK